MTDFQVLAILAAMFMYFFLGIGVSYGHQLIDETSEVFRPAWFPFVVFMIWPMVIATYTVIFLAFLSGQIDD